MKFNKALKQMIKNPKLTFSCESALQQDLTSIKYWLTSDDQSEAERQKHFDEFIKADWILDAVQNG